MNNEQRAIIGSLIAIILIAVILAFLLKDAPDVAEEPTPTLMSESNTAMPIPSQNDITPTPQVIEVVGEGKVIIETPKPTPTSEKDEDAPTPTPTPQEPTPTPKPTPTTTPTIPLPDSVPCIEILNFNC